MAKVLYITYDGIMEPLGQSQVYQYLKELAKAHNIILVSYEKRHDWWAKVSKREEVIKMVEQSGIHWIPLRYHKRPTALATAYDLLVGLLVGIYLVIRYRIQIVHARSYVPSVIALALKQFLNKKFIFDMRGFWADERIDGSIWKPNSRIYRIAKWFEKQFLTHADIVVSLTHAGVTAMRQFPYLKDNLPQFEVIPTCTNLELFHPNKENKAKTSEQLFTLGYVGSVGTWYLFEHVLECFNILLKIHPNSRLLILNRNEHQYIQKLLDKFAIPKTKVEIKAIEYSKVGMTMATNMDAGIFFIKPVFSKQASSPTKMGEFLACGIPCLANAGVGDVEHILSNEKVGIVVHEFSSLELEQAVQSLLELVNDPETKERCIEVAHQYFSLDDGIQRYDQIYRSLLP